jgi:DNA-binding transcriptional regulator YhcF (GntR family)
MAVKIKIDKKRDSPVYRQIIEQVTTLIRDGKLNAGDRLPPERDLALELGVARGTVKKAYERLAANKILEMVQGRGSFISSEQDVLNEGRKEKAVRIINRSLSELEKLKFSSREISSLFQILLMEYEEKRQSIHVAGIDCNPEALSIFDRQLRHISNLRLFRFLLDDLYRDSDINKKLSEFDMILTTSTHYAEIIGLFPELKGKIIQVAVSPSQQTIIELAQIPPSSKLGIVTFSRNFYNIIKGKIQEFQISPKNIKHIFEDSAEDFPEFISDRDILITPPKCFLENRKELQAHFQKFMNNGGRILRFDYQMERGALIHIEEKISQIINGRDR